MLHRSFLALPVVAALFATPASVEAFVEEVPFVTSPDSVTAAMLDIARVRPGDHLIDLGSGDGRIVIAAAHRGATGLGVEIDPRLVAESRENARRAGVAARARFLEQDLFRTDLAPATVITMYLLPEVNLRLRPALLTLRPGTRVVSHDWDMGDWPPDRTEVLEVPEKEVGPHKRSYVHLWTVPARVDGLWCAQEPGGEHVALRLSQSFQLVQGELHDGAEPIRLAGRVEGDAVTLAPVEQGGRWQLRWSGGGLRAVAAEGSLAPLRRKAWRPARGTSCPHHDPGG